MEKKRESCKKLRKERLNRMNCLPDQEFPLRGKIAEYGVKIICK